MKKRTLVPAALLAALILAATMSLSTVWAGGVAHCTGVEATVAEGDRVMAKGACFMPTVLNIEVGQTVEFDVGQELPHTVTGANLEWGSPEKSDPLVSHTFTKAGVYPYSCAYHPGMIGAIVVHDAQPAPVGASIQQEPGDAGMLGGAVASWFGFGAIATVVGGGGLLAAARVRRADGT